MDTEKRNKPNALIIGGVVLIVAMVVIYFILMMFFPDLFRGMNSGDTIPVQD